MQPIVTTNARKRSASKPGDTMLDAVRGGRISLGYGCSIGRCFSCKTQVLAGTVTALHDETGLGQAEREAGSSLICVRGARSDAHLEAQDLGAVSLFPAQTYPCHIHTLRHVAADARKVVLRLPPLKEFSFHPGNYVEVIGNAASTCKRIELRIRKVGRGAMSADWFDMALVSDVLRLHNPLRTTCLCDIVSLGPVFLASKSGIAPVKAMLDGLKAAPRTEQPAFSSVYWGARTRVDLCWHLEASDFEFRLVPLHSRADATWRGVRGPVRVERPVGRRARHVTDTGLRPRIQHYDPQHARTIAGSRSAREALSSRRSRMLSIGLTVEETHL